MLILIFLVLPAMLFTMYIAGKEQAYDEMANAYNEHQVKELLIAKGRLDE